MNPAAEFLALKTAEVSARKERDVALWRTWMDQGRRPEHLEPILDAFAPVLQRKVMQWKAPQVSTAAFRAELQRQLIGALEKYDPTRGAALNTHVEIYLQKAKRYNNQYANAAYIPEGQAAQIGKIDKASDELKEELGRDPTHGEIAGRVGLPASRVARIQSARVRDIPASRFETDPTERGPQYAEQQLELARHLLPQILPKPDLQTLFRFTYPTGADPQVTSTGELARRMGRSASQISRLKTQMGEALRPYLTPPDARE
ncbi:hypothetical protein LVJ94_35385 [Pendulispora rubella]|uniref:RNA polymerase sigma-70 region 3 domain-containing protein n=1 Tax=Pendulispora rubella TaxID=2741070 RepID=A0ABZ2L0R5_9BACT